MLYRTPAWAAKFTTYSQPSIAEIIESESRISTSKILTLDESKLSKPNRFDYGETIFIKRLLQRDLPLKLRESIVELLFEKYVL